MKNTLYLNWKSNPSQGEVFTPIELVRDMLDGFPTEIWTNPTTTFIDPCMGKGTFLIEIVRRLVDIYGYSEEDAKSRVFGCDNRVKYVNYLKRRGYKNVFHKDSLKEVFKMKFDVCLGNPPYQDTSADRGKFNQLGNKKLWKLYLKKSSEIVKDGGIINFLVPQAVTKSTNFGKPSDAILKMGDVKVVEITTGQEKHFKGVGVKICSITFKKTKDEVFTKIDNSLQEFNKLGFVTADPRYQSIALKLLKNDNSVLVSRHTDKIYSEEQLSQLKGIWSTRFGHANFTFERDKEQTKEILWQSKENDSLMNLLKSNLFCSVAWVGFVIVDKRWYHNFWSALSLNPYVKPNSTLEEIMEIYELNDEEKKLILSKDYTNVG